MFVTPWQYATGGLAIALALSIAWGVRVEGLRASHKAAHEQTVKSYQQAQKDAQERHDAEIQALQAHNRRLNDEIDRKADERTVVYRDRVIRLPSAPASCPTGVGSLPGPGVPASDDGSGGSAQLSEGVIIPRDDARICADNTARLEAVRDWALEFGK